MAERLEGKTAVIMGGTEGIGLATTRLFVVEEGAFVFITGHPRKERDEAVKAMVTNVSGVQGDVANWRTLIAFIRPFLRRNGESISFSPMLA